MLCQIIIKVPDDLQAETEKPELSRCNFFVLAMKQLNENQMLEIQGGKINWESLGCGIGVSLMFGLAALGGPAGIAAVALAASTVNTVICAIVFER